MNAWRIALVFMVTFAMGSGCAKRDWIEETLVTVDVTGVWVGSATRASAYAGILEIRLELEQSGAKVIGRLAVLGAGGGGLDMVKSEPIEGTVSGDVFRFSGQAKSSLSGQMTVDGDEMKGDGTVGIQRKFSLRRINSSPRPGQP